MMKYMLVATLIACLSLTGCGDSGNDNASTSRSDVANLTKQADHDHSHDHVEQPIKLQVADIDAIQAMIKQTAEDDKILVIDFWATWCAPCVAAFPKIHDGVKNIGTDHVRLVSITFDSPGKFEKKAIEFLAKNHALKDAFIVPEDSDAQIAIVDGIGDQWNDLVVPAWFVFDREGNIVGQYFQEKDVPAMLEQIRKLAVPVSVSGDAR